MQNLLLLPALIAALVAFITLGYLNSSHHLMSDKAQAILLVIGTLSAIVYSVFLTYALVFEASLVITK